MIRVSVSFTENIKNVLDLGDLAKLIKEDKKYCAVVDAIERLLGIFSIRHDLQSSLRAIDAMRNFVESPYSIDSPELSRNQSYDDIGSALFTHAIILYVRATGTQSIGRYATVSRRGGNILKQYDDQEKEKHERIVSLRNGAIAHYGSNAKDPIGPWSNDTVLMIIRDSEFSFSDPALRVN